MNGIIVIDKPAGLTSFSALGKVKRILGEKKAGHAGTLDPFATGVLPVALGNASRFLETFPSHDKSYRAAVRFGQTTDTLDITGRVLSETKSDITLEQLEELLPEFTGTLEQIPPMYSALKMDGVRLYELARKGVEVERKARTVNVFSITVAGFSFEEQTVLLDVSVSAGTYIRSLARDIGEKLGCGAVLSALDRTAALGFTKAQSVTLEQLTERQLAGEAQQLVIPVDKALGYPSLTVTEPQAKRFLNGGELDCGRINTAAPGIFCVYSPSEVFLGVGEIREGEYRLTARKIISH